MEVAQRRTTMKNPKQNLPELEEYLELCNEMTCVLQKMGKASQPLSIGIKCNPFSKVSYNLLPLNSLNLDVEDLMSKENGQNNS